MDRIQFIDNDKFDGIFKEHFDQLMVLYDLVGRYDNINVSANETNSTNISFDIIFSNINESNTLKFHLDNLPFVNKYNIKYNIFSQIESNVLHIDINRVP